MYFKSLKHVFHIIIIIITSIIYTNCSTLKNISKYHDINQGRYLNIQEIQNIHVGMSKNEIFLNIGSPTLQDLFGSNTWYYIYYHHTRNGIVIQQTYILKFNQHDILIDLKK